MLYRAIGLMSGSSLDGLDIVFAELEESGGKWTYEIQAADCYPYEPAWRERLAAATTLSALDYLLLHTDYGHYLGQQVTRFIETQQLQYRVALVASHGHTSFHKPAHGMTAQLGDGSAIAAETQLPVVSDLRSLDVALHGQGAPIVPIGERLLLGGYDYFLNLGGIANVSIPADPFTAFDICACNRVLDLLARDAGLDYDENGRLAAEGNLLPAVLAQLEALDYYRLPAPKSLANDFGTDLVYPILKKKDIEVRDALRTYAEHISLQIKKAIQDNSQPAPTGGRLLITGGGAFNHFLMERIREHLKDTGIEAVVPDEKLVKYKEALIMALIGVLRWREETTVLSSVTGAKRDSVGGAMWMGQEG